MTDMTNDDTKLDANNPQGLLEYIQRLKAENARLESRSRLGLNFEDTPDENVVRYSTRVPLSVHEPENDVMTDDDGTTHDLIIGDNYPGLLTLLPKYEGRINVIYIDPPYNTGSNGFIYNDRYINPEDSYKHSKWLSFMEPRLKLAKRLLSDDGIIFVSIDDHEQARLRLLMDWIFGEDNFIATMIWHKRTRLNSATRISIDTEYVLMYSKSISSCSVAMEKSDSEFPLVDEYCERRGGYRINSLDRRLRYSQSLDYVINHDGDCIYPGGSREDFQRRMRGIVSDRDWEWRWSKRKLEWGIKNGFIVFKNNKVYYKIYEKVDNSDNPIERKIPYSSLIDGILSSYGSKNIRPILNDGNAFSFPKPVMLIRFLIGMHSDKNALVLDFFAGSGTTGQAVAELNAENGGHRHCIMITDEGRNVDDPSAVNIARDITYTRLKRVLTGQDWADGKEHPCLNQNLRTHHLTSVGTMMDDGIINRDVDVFITDIIHHDDSNPDSPLEHARSILDSWRSAVQD